MGVAQPDRRQWPRLHLKLHVTFQVADAEHEWEGEGTTRDVSAGGAYFYTPDLEMLSEGTTVTMRMGGFSEYDAGHMLRTVAGKATVVRLEETAGGGRDGSFAPGGVAVRFEQRPQVSPANDLA